MGGTISGCPAWNIHAGDPVLLGIDQNGRPHGWYTDTCAGGSDPATARCRSLPWQEERFYGCPVGQVLAPGATISWSSDGDSQGVDAGTVNGQEVTVMCGEQQWCGGRPESPYGTGGGWQVCL